MLSSIQVPFFQLGFGPHEHLLSAGKFTENARKLKEDPDELPRKASRIRRKLMRPLKPYGNSQDHGCLLPQDLGGTTANPPTCNKYMVEIPANY